MKMRVLIIDRHADPEDAGSRYVQMARRWKKEGVFADILTMQYSPRRGEIPIRKNKEVVERNGIRYVVLKNKPYQFTEKSFESFVKKIGVHTRMALITGGWLRRYQAVIVTSTMPPDVHTLEKYCKRKRKTLLYDMPEIWPMTAVEHFGRSTGEKWMKHMTLGEHDAYCFTNMIISRIRYGDLHLIAENYHPHEGGYYTYIPEGVDLQQAEEWNEPDMEAVRFLIQQRDAGKRTFTAVWHGDTGEEILPLLDVLQERVGSMAVCILCPEDKMQQYRDEIETRGLTGSAAVFPKGSEKNWFSTLKLSEVAYHAASLDPLHRFGYAPRHLLQTMAAGRPVLYRVHSSDSIVKEAVAGRSTEDMSPESLAATVEFFMAANDQTLDFMGQNGPRYLAKYHDIDKLSREYLAIVTKPYRKASYSFKNVIGGKTVNVGEKE